ncbi:hypothetical protein [Hymenobacter saemangeumensis]|uniref:hypothetical protein n=1 Tax=Hymenobacter saemangeumensis TaxID=1084522 RepID=UPI0031E546F0
MRNKRVLKLLRAVGQAVLLGFTSGAAKAFGLLLLTHLLQRQLGKGLGQEVRRPYFLWTLQRQNKIDNVFEL